MPRIKVYKGNRAIIPVDVAKVATAYQCPFTDALFNTKKQYVSHLKELRKIRMHRAARQARHFRLRDELLSQPSFEKVIEWIHNHPEFFFDNVVRNDPFSRMVKDYAQKRLEFEIKITDLSLQWSPEISNTYSAPLNGYTNWDKKDKSKPTSYPGWSGRITFKMSSVDTFSSRVFERTGINTGGGGGSSGVYGYEVKFFDADWSEIASRREKFETMHRLGGPSYNQFSYSKGKVTV